MSKLENIKNYALLKNCWAPLTIIYDPLKAGSIDGTDTEPHDKAIIRAQNADYKPNKKIKGIPEHTIFVTRLLPKTTRETIEDAFSRFGPIMRCRLVEDIVTGRSKCYAFVEYERQSDAMQAYNVGKLRIDGKEVFIDMECERLLPGWVPRRLGGGFSGKKESGQLRFGGRDRQFIKPICLMSKFERRLDERNRVIRSKYPNNQQM